MRAILTHSVEILGFLGTIHNASKILVASKYDFINTFHHIQAVPVRKRRARPRHRWDNNWRLNSDTDMAKEVVEWRAENIRNCNRYLGDYCTKRYNSFDSDHNNSLLVDNDCTHCFLHAEVGSNTYWVHNMVSNPDILRDYDYDYDYDEEVFQSHHNKNHHSHNDFRKNYFRDVLLAPLMEPLHSSRFFFP